MLGVSSSASGVLPKPMVFPTAKLLQLHFHMLLHPQDVLLPRENTLSAITSLKMATWDLEDGDEDEQW